MIKKDELNYISTVEWFSDGIWIDGVKVTDPEKERLLWEAISPFGPDDGQPHDKPEVACTQRIMGIDYENRVVTYEGGRR